MATLTQHPKDIIAGIESEIDTVLLMSGVSTPSTLRSFSYAPKYILPSVASLSVKA